jgi:hypothetical protein
MKVTALLDEKRMAIYFVIPFISLILTVETEVEVNAIFMAGLNPQPSIILSYREFRIFLYPHGQRPVAVDAMVSVA